MTTHWSSSGPCPAAGDQTTSTRASLTASRGVELTSPRRYNIWNKSEIVTTELSWPGLVSVIRPRPRFIMTNSATHSDNSTLAWQSVSCWEFVTNVSTGSANLHHHSLVLINKRCKLRCDDDGILTVPPPGPPALHPLRVLAPGVGAARARRGHDH